MASGAGAGAGAGAAGALDDVVLETHPVEKFDVPYERRYSLEDMREGEDEPKIAFTTRQGTQYIVNKKYLKPSAMISNFIEDGDGDVDADVAAEENMFALTSLDDRIIAPLLDFLKMHHDEPMEAIPEKKIDRYLVKKVDDVIKQSRYASYIVDVFKAGLIFDVMLAANYLCISELENLTGFYVAFLYKTGHTPEKVLATFGISQETMDADSLQELKEMKKTFNEYIDY